MTRALATVLLPLLVVLAQGEGMQPHGMDGMCPGCGGAGEWVVGIGVAILIASAALALLALAVFLVRRSRPHRRREV